VGAESGFKKIKFRAFYALPGAKGHTLRKEEHCGETGKNKKKKSTTKGRFPSKRPETTALKRKRKAGGGVRVDLDGKESSRSIVECAILQ